MDSFISFSIASQKTALPPFPLTYLYMLSIKHLLVLITVCFVYSTKAQHCTWTENHEFTANVVDADALLYILSFLVWKMLPQDERNSGWGQRFFQICLTTITPRYTTSSNFKSGPSIFSKKHSTNTCRECDVLRQWVDWESIANELKATAVVLQGQQPRHSNSTLSNRALLPFAYQSAQQRKKGMAENHTKS